jgi:hypothetical protein
MGEGPLVLWTLVKDSKVLHCEVRRLTADDCNLEVFEDDRLAFSHRWSFGAPAQFVAASLRRAKLREGWTDVASVIPPRSKTSFVFDWLEFVASPVCVYAPTLMVNLNDALRILDWRDDYRFIDTDALPETDPRRGYPSPTLLWNGTEIFGAPEPTPPFKMHSRAYEDGVPSAATLVARLRQLRAIC